MEWTWQMLWARGWDGSHPIKVIADSRASTTAYVDHELLRLYYGMVADRLSCSRCSARLRRPVLITPAPGDMTIGVVAVTTRCRGWWRHRHRATVTGRAADDLQLGELRPA